MNIALWLLQVLLAAVFLTTGSRRVFNAARNRARQGSPTGGLTVFIGLSEMAGAFGLVVPWAAGVVPVLTPVAAAALAVVMVLAVGHHVQHRDPITKMVPALVLLCITTFVAWERS